MAKSAPAWAYGDFARSLGALQQALDSGKVPSIVVAFGKSDYLIQKTALVLRRKLRRKGKAAYSSYEAGDLSAEVLSTLWEQRSLFEGHPFYFVCRCEKKDPTALLAPLAAPRGARFCFGYEGSDLPVKLRAQFERLGATWVPCFDPSPADLPRFIAGLARNFEVSFTPEALSLLVEAMGVDLFRIENEVGNLSLLFAGRKEPLTADDIRPHLGMLREDHVFKLDNFLVEGRFAEAEALLIDLLRRGEKALIIITVLARHFRNALRISEELGAGVNPHEIAATLRLPVPVVRGYTQYVKRFGPGDFARCLDQCRLADLALKTSPVADEVIVARILSEVSAAAGART